MWPTLLRIGSFEITTFGLMMFLAFLGASWILTLEFRRRGLDEELVSSIVIAGAAGGILGAKIYYAILYHDMSLLFSRAGLVWYGGLLGGFLAVSALMLIKRVDYLRAADGAAPALAIGYAIGRIGCFLVGDDYGRPTDSWVGIAFPKGAPPTTAASLRQFGVAVDPSIPGDTLLRVYPTQIFESLAFFLVFGFLMWISRNHYVRGRVWSLFLICLGVERFLIEIIRAKDDRFFGSFTLAQLISVGLVIVGLAILATHRRTRPAGGRAASGSA